MTESVGQSRTYLLIAIAWLLLATTAVAQRPKHEFRGAWIATVINLDWPSQAGFDTELQKSELAGIMDGLAEAGINAVFFQVRSEGEAMYDSSIEPWSQHLTGIQGAEPFPYYDPLELAVELAHARGMELHAWFNPYRVRRNLNDGITPDPTHVSVRHPEWVLTVNSIAVLNPGIEAVRKYVVDVILDVVERYDIDGVHFDDYFYPESIGTRDLATWDSNNPDNLSLDNWRRDNVNRLIEAVSDGIASVNPDIKFGVSPPGIWQDGVPNGISGSSGYSRLYADAVTWLAEEWVDYIAPQLYWKFGGAQDYALLAPWWASVSNGRHIYPGLAAYKAEPATYSGTLYNASELPEQIRFSRIVSGIQGNVLFRAKNLTSYSSAGLSDSLRTDLYANPAITPVMLWRDVFPTGPPRDLGIAIPTKRGIGLGWSPPEAGLQVPRRYAVYRQRSLAQPTARDMTNDPANLLGITYETTFGDVPPLHVEPYWYVVTALTANSIESDESNMVSFVSDGTAIEIQAEIPFSVSTAAPNPFRGFTTISYELNAPGMLRAHVYDVIGRRVAVLRDAFQRAGPDRIIWNGTNDAGEALPSGLYFISVGMNERSTTRPVVLVR